MESSAEIFREKTESSLMLATNVGNMYTPSLYGGLISYLCSGKKRVTHSSFMFVRNILIAKYFLQSLSKIFRGEDWVYFRMDQA